MNILITGIQNAVEDPRFDPVAPEEVATLSVEISVLTAPGVGADVEITSGNPIDLRVEGPPDALASLTADRVRAFIDVRGRRVEIEKEVPFQERVLVQGLPEGVRFAEPVYATARFKLPARTPEKATP